MADNVTADPGSGGATFATDDDGTAHHPYVKLEFGADNTQTKVSSSNPLPVNWAGTAPPIGAGTEAAALRVTLATDSTGVLSIDDNGGSLTVDGTVTANLSATDNAVLDNIDTNTGFGSVTGGGVEASALRVTLASDSTGVLSVDDNGGSLTVDGTVTANLSATDNAVLDSIQSNTANLTNCIVQDDSPFTPATGYLMMIGGEYDDTAPDSVDEGDAGNIRITANRSMHTTLRDAAGNERGANVDASNNLQVVETNSAAILADTANMDTNLGTVAGAVSGSEMQVDVVASLPAGTNVVGDVGISGARTSGGTTLYRNTDVDETEDQVKGTAGQIYWIHAMNLTASVLYLQIYNATAASVTVGSTTPDLTFPLATPGDTNGAGFTLAIPNGIAFGTAITIACTTTIGGSSGPAANGCLVNLGYA